MHIDMIEGKIDNPFAVIKSLTNLAKKAGSSELRIEGTIANERLFNVLKGRYGLVTVGSKDIIYIPVN